MHNYDIKSNMYWNKFIFALCKILSKPRFRFSVSSWSRMVRRWEKDRHYGAQKSRGHFSGKSCGWRT